MSKNILLFALLFSVNAIFAQADAAKTGVKKNPEFVGGKEALIKYMINNIKYPADARDKKLQAKVIVSFTIDKDGTVSNVAVKELSKIKSDIKDPKTGAVTQGVMPDKSYESIKKEAIRVVKNMPKWKPGSLNGEPAQVDYTLPLNFKL